jgi:hypothetical protein
MRIRLGSHSSPPLLVVEALLPKSPSVVFTVGAIAADGSTDLYFGPTPPAGKPGRNWIKTLPNKGWFTYFRLYGPTQPYFDKTWQLPDIEEVKG